MNSNVTNQSTVAAFAILEAMAEEGDPSRVTDLARALDMPRARVYRYLQTLVSLGYVRQDPVTERYRLTLKLFRLGQAIADATQLTSIARIVMAGLRDAVGHTVTLSRPEEGGMRVMDIVRTDAPVQIVTRPGALLPFHSSAQGKVALAWGGIDLPGDAPDPARLAREVREARARGWATAPEETLPGVNALSAPILDAQGALAATITIAGSVADIAPDPDATLIAAVTGAAREISTELGCREYPT